MKGWTSSQHSHCSTATKLHYWKEETLLWTLQILQSKSPKHIAWLNFKTVILKKIKYPLMATTFLQWVQRYYLPSLKYSVTSHWDQPTLSSWHDLLSFGSLWIGNSPFVWFSRFPPPLSIAQIGLSTNTTGQLIHQSYKSLQIKLGLPGEPLHKSCADWSILWTNTWLMHTWKHTSEYGWLITTDLPSPQLLKCKNDQKTYISVLCAILITKVENSRIKHLQTHMVTNHTYIRQSQSTYINVIQSVRNITIWQICEHRPGLAGPTIGQVPHHMELDMCGPIHT